jgi:ATP/maltotriose-dependent transcriptional regulator MalT
MSPLEQGQSALAQGAWETAKQAFAHALEVESNPAAHDGMGIALWWLNDIEAAHRHRMEAVMGFRQQGEVRKAGRIAAWLAREQLFFQNNPGAMQGWFARAERLVADVAPCPEKAWVTLYRASLLAPPAELASITNEIVLYAHTTNEGDLEALALGFQGIAAIGLTRISDGIAALDEAMAMATGGEVRDLMVVSEIFCLMLSACEQIGDTTRSEQWYRAADTFARRYQCQFLSAYCRTAYGGLLTATGKWEAAEQTLQEAIDIFNRGHQGLKVHAVLKLAELHLQQGKIIEAEALLQGYEDYAAAALPLARLYRAKGNAPLAQATLERTLSQSHPPTLDHLPHLLLLIDLLLEQGNLAVIQTYIERAEIVAEPTRSDLLIAQVEVARGKWERASGDTEAQMRFQAALKRLRSLEQCLVAGQARLEMAQVLKSSDRPGAIAWARAALATFERIGAEREINEAAALLREMGIQPRPKTRTLEALTEREKEVFALLKQGLSNKEIAQRLVISPKTAEHHVGQILSKLGLSTRAETIAYALTNQSGEK